MLAIVTLALCTGSVFLLSFISILNPGKANHIANRWLGVFLLCLGLAFLADLFRELNISSQYLFVSVFSEITRFAAAPSLYLSVCYFSSPERSLRRGDILHFIPFFLFIINCLPVLLPWLSGPMFSNRFDINGVGKYIRTFMFLVIKVQVVGYWVASFVKLSRHPKNMRFVFSSLPSVDLKWLKYFLLSLLLIFLIWFNEAFFGITWINDYSSYGYLVSIYSLSYFALKQKEIFPFQASALTEIKEILKESNLEGPKHQRIAEDKLELLIVKLKHLMESDKYFLDHDLGLPHLAEKMDLTSHELSYLLNRGLGISFFEFVNRYRVERAKLLLLSDNYKHLNMLGIAFETGFNSKTTFNTAFKKITGVSPSEFKKSAGGNLNELLSKPKTA